MMNRIFYNFWSLDCKQVNPDPNFTTVSSPNPEEPQALHLAMKAAEERGADMVLATDPDADRVGVAVRDPLGQFCLLTGNQVGVLLLDYVLSQQKKTGHLPSNGAAIKTMVTSEMGRAIAQRYGVEMCDTVPGFKYIAAKIHDWGKSGHKHFLFGYEESDGYLIGNFCRDKDAIQACMMIAEMGAYYQNRGLSLYGVLHKLFQTVGFYQEDQVSIDFPGVQGQSNI